MQKNKRCTWYFLLRFTRILELWWRHLSPLHRSFAFAICKGRLIPIYHPRKVSSLVGSWIGAEILLSAFIVFVHSFLKLKYAEHLRLLWICTCHCLLVISKFRRVWPLMAVRIVDNFLGYGVRWTSDGKQFRGFLEPQMADGHDVHWRHWRRKRKTQKGISFKTAKNINANPIYCFVLFYTVNNVLSTIASLLIWDLLFIFGQQCYCMNGLFWSLCSLFYMSDLSAAIRVMAKRCKIDLWYHGTYRSRIWMWSRHFDW